jgi:hypothetical protein
MSEQEVSDADEDRGTLGEEQHRAENYTVVHEQGGLVKHDGTERVVPQSLFIHQGVAFD